MASGDRDALAASIDRGWERFLELVAETDLSAQSRKAGWTGRQIVAHLGYWESGRTLEDLLADAHDGEARVIDQHEVDRRVLAETAGASDEEVLDSIARARQVTADWFAGDGPATWGLVPTSSPLGPLPVLTVISAATYQLGVALLDLQPCGAPVDRELSELALSALVDVTGGLAARKHFDGTFIAVTPQLIVGAGSSGGHWRTGTLSADPHFGPGVEAPAHVVLDVTSSRAAVPHLYRTGQLHVRDLPGLIRLAPVLDGVPGVPPLGAVGRAMAVVDVVGGLFGRLGRR